MYKYARASTMSYRANHKCVFLNYGLCGFHKYKSDNQQKFIFLLWIFATTLTYPPQGRWAVTWAHCAPLGPRGIKSPSIDLCWVNLFSFFPRWGLQPSNFRVVKDFLGSVQLRSNTNLLLQGTHNHRLRLDVTQNPRLIEITNVGEHHLKCFDSNEPRTYD